MTLIERVRQHVVINGDCWEWFGAYQTCGSTPTIRYNRKAMPVRRAILLDRGVIIPKGKWVTYTCGNAKCVNPEHIGIKTRSAVQKRNAAEMPASTRLMRNRKISARLREVLGKLTEADVLAIRASTEPEATLAARYNVTKPTIGAIRRYLKHKHIAPNAFIFLLRA